MAATPRPTTRRPSNAAWRMYRVQCEIIADLQYLYEHRDEIPGADAHITAIAAFNRRN